jgi:hypothetical protein
MCCDVGGLRQPFAHVACRADMPFLEKLADITVSGRHVADMSATFPAKDAVDPDFFNLLVPHACIRCDVRWVLLLRILFAVFARHRYHHFIIAGSVAAVGLAAPRTALTAVAIFLLLIFLFLLICAMNRSTTFMHSSCELSKPSSAYG